MAHLNFNNLLTSAGLDPKCVKLMRHTSKAGDIRLTWLNDIKTLELFQSTQEAKSRKDFIRPYWASFIGHSGTQTLFVGIYTAKFIGPVEKPFYEPLSKTDITGTVFDAYACELTPLLAEYRGRLSVEWGGGWIRWAQNADANNKAIVELSNTVIDMPWPGFMNLVMPLTELAFIPKGWKERLSEAKGIYLLACPKEGKAYVGKADGAKGFLGRWEEYARNGHGGNKLLQDGKERQLQVTILQVARLGAEPDEITEMETLWKTKLMSRIVGLNAN